MKTAEENGTTTVDGILILPPQRCKWFRFSSLASGFATIVNQTNQELKVAAGEWRWHYLIRQ